MKSPPSFVFWGMNLLSRFALRWNGMNHLLQMTKYPRLLATLQVFDALLFCTPEAKCTSHLLYQFLANVNMWARGQSNSSTRTPLRSPNCIIHVQKTGIGKRYRRRRSLPTQLGVPTLPGPDSEPQTFFIFLWFCCVRFAVTHCRSATWKYAACYVCFCSP